MNNKIHINIDELKKVASSLVNGQQVFLTGNIYTARDAAHKRLLEMIKNKEELPINIKNSVLYYCGPTPAPPGMVIGSCGPTSSYRMDAYLLPLLKLGLAGMIGKGQRSRDATEAIKKYNALYFMAIGGAGALACKYVKDVDEVAFLDLGCESIKRLYVENFPVIAVV